MFHHKLWASNIYTFSKKKLNTNRRLRKKEFFFLLWGLLLPRLKQVIKTKHVYSKKIIFNLFVCCDLTQTDPTSYFFFFFFSSCQKFWQTDRTSRIGEKHCWGHRWRAAAPPSPPRWRRGKSAPPLSAAWPGRSGSAPGHVDDNRLISRMTRNEDKLRSEETAEREPTQTDAPVC